MAYSNNEDEKRRRAEERRANSAAAAARREALLAQNEANKAAQQSTAAQAPSSKAQTTRSDSAGARYGGKDISDSAKGTILQNSTPKSGYKKKNFGDNDMNVVAQSRPKQTFDASKMTYEEVMSAATRIVYDDERDALLKAYQKSASRKGSANYTETVPTLESMRAELNAQKPGGLYKDYGEEYSKRMQEDFTRDYSIRKGMKALGGLYDVNGAGIDMNTADYATVVQGIRNIADEDLRKAKIKELEGLTKIKGSRFYGQKLDKDLLGSYLSSPDFTQDDYDKTVKKFNDSFYPQDGYDEQNHAKYLEFYEDIEGMPYSADVKRQLIDKLNSVYTSSTSGKEPPNPDDLKQARADEQAAAEAAEAKRRAENPTMWEQVEDFVSGLFPKKDQDEEPAESPEPTASPAPTPEQLGMKDRGRTASATVTDVPTPMPTPTPTATPAPAATSTPKPEEKKAASTGARTVQELVESGHFPKRSEVAGPPAPGKKEKEVGHGRRAATVPEMIAAGAIEQNEDGMIGPRHQPRYPKSVEQALAKQPKLEGWQALEMYMSGRLLSEANYDQIRDFVEDSDVLGDLLLATKHGGARYALESSEADTTDGTLRRSQETGPDLLQYRRLGKTLGKAANVAASGGLPNDMTYLAYEILGDVMLDAKAMVENGSVTVPNGANLYEHVISQRPELQAKVDQVYELQRQVNEINAENLVKQKEAETQAYDDAVAASLKGVATDEQIVMLNSQPGMADIDINDDGTRAMYRARLNIGRSMWYEDDGAFWTGSSAAAQEGQTLKKVGTPGAYGEYKRSLQQEALNVIDDYTRVAMSHGMDLETYLGQTGADMDDIMDIAYNRMVAAGSDILADPEAVAGIEAASSAPVQSIGAMNAAGMGVKHGAASYAESFLDTPYQIYDLATYEARKDEITNEYVTKYGPQAPYMYRRDLIAYAKSGELDKESSEALLADLGRASSAFDIAYDIDPGFLEGMYRDTLENLGKTVDELEASIMYATSEERMLFNGFSNVVNNGISMGVSTAAAALTGGMGLGATAASAVGTTVGFGLTSWDASFEDYTSRGYSKQMAAYMATGQAAITVAMNMGGTDAGVDLYFGKNSAQAGFEAAIRANRSRLGEFGKQMWQTGLREGAEEVADTAASYAFGLLDGVAKDIDEGKQVTLSSAMASMANEFESTDVPELAKELGTSGLAGMAYGWLFGLGGIATGAVKAGKAVKLERSYDSLDIAGKVVRGEMQPTMENVASMLQALKTDLQDPKFRRFVDKANSAAQETHNLITAVLSGEGNEPRNAALTESRKADQYELAAEQARKALDKNKTEYATARDAALKGDLEAAKKMEGFRLAWSEAGTLLKESTEAAAKCREQAALKISEWLKAGRAEARRLGKEQLSQAAAQVIAARNAEAQRIVDAEAEAERNRGAEDSGETDWGDPFAAPEEAAVEVQAEAAPAAEPDEDSGFWGEPSEAAPAAEASAEESALMGDASPAAASDEAALFTDWPITDLDRRYFGGSTDEEVRANRAAQAVRAMKDTLRGWRNRVLREQDGTDRGEPVAAQADESAPFTDGPVTDFDRRYFGGSTDEEVRANRVAFAVLLAKNTIESERNFALEEQDGTDRSEPVAAPAAEAAPAVEAAPIRTGTGEVVKANLTRHQKRVARAREVVAMNEAATRAAAQEAAPAVEASAETAPRTMPKETGDAPIVATPTKGKAKKNPAQTFKRLAKDLGVGQVFGTKKMNGLEKTATGYADQRAGYVASGVNYASDVETMGHEIGHQIAAKLGITGTDAMAANLPDRFHDAYDAADLNEEAFSHFFWQYLVNDSSARAFAGRSFIRSMERRLKQEGMYKAVKTAQREIRQFFNATQEEQWELMVRDKSDRAKGDTIGELLMDSERAFVTAMIDRTRPAEDVNAAVREAEGSNRIDESVNLRHSALMVATTAKRADIVLNKHLTDVDGTIVGDSLKKRFKDAKLKGKDFNKFVTYMLAKHSLDRDKQDKLVVDRRIFPEADTAAMVKRLEREHPEFKDAQRAFQEFRHDFMMEYMVKPGYMTQQTLDMFEAMYPNYVPTYRVKDRKGRGAGGKSFKIMQAKGSTEEIINPIDSFVEMVNSIVAMNMKNEMLKTWDRVYENYDGMGIFGRKVTEDTKTTAMDMTSVQEKVEKILNDAGSDTDIVQEVLDAIGDTQYRRSGAGKVDQPNVVSVQKADGSTVFYEIFDDLLFDMLEATPDHGKGAFDLLAPLTRGMTALTTGSNPVFGILRNSRKDFQNSVTYGSWAKTYATGLPTWLRSAWDVWRESGDYKQYEALGGGGWTRVYAGTRKGAAEYRGELFDGYNTANVGRTAKWLGKKLWNGITFARLNEVIEQASRFAEYKYGKHDLSTPEGRRAAYLAAQDVTTDFSRGGSSRLAREAKAFIPFFNASLQGIYRTGRQFTAGEADRAPARFVKTVVNVGLTSALASMWMISSMDDEDKEEFFWLSDDLKAKHLYIPNFAPDVLGESPLIRIPLNQDPLAYAIHAAVTNAAWTGQGEEWAIELCAVADNIKNSLNPINSTSVDPLISIMTNKNWYGSNIVPRSMDGRHPTAQYSEETPQLFVDASFYLDALTEGKVSISPMMLQYIAEQYSGFVGQMVIPFMSKNEHTGEINGIDAVIGDVRDTLVSDPLRSNDVVSTVYDNMELLGSITKTGKSGKPMNDLRAGLTDREARRAYDEAYDLSHKGGALYEAQEAITDGYAQIEAYEARTDLSDEEKYELQSKVRRDMIETALDANEIMAEYREKYIDGESFLTRFMRGPVLK